MTIILHKCPTCGADEGKPCRTNLADSHNHIRSDKVENVSTLHSSNECSKKH